MELSEKLVFHIPEKTWREDHLEDIGVDSALEDLTDALAGIGLTSFYIQQVTGGYKGRRYPERLMVVFCEHGPLAEQAAGLFEQWFRSHNEILKQEAFSYEWNGTLTVKGLTGQPELDNCAV